MKRLLLLLACFAIISSVMTGALLKKTVDDNVLYLNNSTDENEPLRDNEIQSMPRAGYTVLGIGLLSGQRQIIIERLQTLTEAKHIFKEQTEEDDVSRRTICGSGFHLNTTPTVKERDEVIAYLTVIDDDGDIHYMTDIYPLMQEIQISISSAVTIKRIGSEERWMDWDDIVFLNENGCEILNHTYSHYTGTEILELDDETIFEGYEKARNELLQRGIRGGNYLVYSSSTGNFERVQKIASQLFECGIKIGGSEINTASSNQFSLSRYRIDYAATEGREDWNLDDMKSYAEEVAGNGGWAIWMLHTSNAIWRQRVCLDEAGEVLYVDGEPVPMVDENGEPVLDICGSNPTVGSTMLIPMLKEAILYAQELGVQVVSVDEAYNAIYGSE